MEIATEFETYIELNDEEYKVLIQATGDIVNDSFQHEFGYKIKNYIDNIFINAIINTENDEFISFSVLDKKQKNILLELANDNLNEQLIGEYIYEF